MERYAAGEAAQAEIEPPTPLDLADALAAAVEADHGEPDPDCGICQAARAYRAARGGA